jgi:ribosomal protein L11 methyltransferase
VIRLAVRCRAEFAERVLADLIAVAPGGVEEERDGDWVEYAIYGPPGEVPSLPEIEAAVADGVVEVSTTEIPDDWADRWRDFHEPVMVADGRLVVRPSWEADAGAGAEVDILIDPGQAFGTGAHATTHLCLELMLALSDAGEATGALADLGTGSGVLAIAAAKLGWSPVIGCDSERAAIEAAEANARANEVSLDLERVNLREQQPPSPPAIVANLTAPLLELVAGRLLSPPDVFIASGLLTSQEDRVVGALQGAGVEIADRRQAGDWMALLARAG